MRGRSRRTPSAHAAPGARLPDPVPLLHVINAPFSLHFIAGQVGFMRERRLATSVITSPGEGLDAFARREEVAAYPVAIRRSITPLHDCVALWRVYRRIRRVRPVIVHAHTPKGGLLGMLGAWLARVPVRIYHIRGLPLSTARGARRVLLRATERLACALSHRVLCVSHSVRALAVAEGLTSSAKIEVLLGGSGNGVDARGRFDPQRVDGAAVRDASGIPRDAIVLGFVGRLIREKGIAELAAAWTALREVDPRLHLLVVGDYEPHDPVSMDAQAVLRDDPRIHRVGWSTDTPPFYAAMDVLVLPSHREGFSNVLLEAAAMGLPVVASRVPGCTDAIEEGATGTTVPAGDAIALVQAVRAYLADAGLRRRHGAAGRARVLRDYQRELLWEALFAEYRRLLMRRGYDVTRLVSAKSAAEAAEGIGPRMASAARRADDLRPPPFERPRDAVSAGAVGRPPDATTPA